MTSGCEAPPGWRDMVATHYPKLVSWLDSVRPPVRKLAVQRASEINNLAGGTALDHALLAELEGIGLKVLEEKILDWDPTLGVTFGAFVRKRIAGEMDNYLTRKRIKTVNSDADARETHVDARERWKSEADGVRAKGNRTSTGGRKVKIYAETARRHPTRLIKANSDALGKELAEALAQLTPNERAVYERRVLAEPQVSHGELATQLGVSRPRIVALEKNARQRMTKLLRGN